jgi:hypothetical protein
MESKSEQMKEKMQHRRIKKKVMMHGIIKCPK